MVPPKPDLKMSGMFCFTAVMLLVLTTGACVELDESDGGYKDLRVSISESVPRDDTIIANIKTLLRSASEFLHKATYGHAIIEVPMTWPKRRSARALSSSAFYRSDVRVDMPEEQHGDKPFTKQKKSCGEPGEFIHLTPGFLATLDKSAAGVHGHGLVRRPKILVLDEAMWQMDGDTDRLIQTTLRMCFSNCTPLAIAHRVHTVLDNDKILVMADGEVAEFGPTKELLGDPTSLFHDIARGAGVIPPNGITSPEAAFPAVRPSSSFVAARILNSVPHA